MDDVTGTITTTLSTSTDDTKLLMNCMLLTLHKIFNNESNLSAFNQTTTFERNSIQLDKNDVNDDMYTNHVQPLNDYTLNARDFMADCLKPSPKLRPYEISMGTKSLWTILFGIMLLIAIVGNCIVIWIVLAHREMRTITNYFLLNLSIADLLMSSLNCVFNFIYMLNSDWPFGALYCSVNNFVGNCTVATSVFTLVAISFDRYVAIVRPLHRRTSRKKARIFLLIIWLLGSILSAPCLLYSAIESKKYHNGKTRTVCYMMWPDGKYPSSVADYVYNIVFLVLTYGIPMLVMVVSYTLMGKELWGSQSIGEHTERQRESVKSKKKVVRMFIAVVSIFGICWMPYHMFYVYAYHNPYITSSSYVPNLFLAFYWLAMSNTMVNPIIYYWMNRKFRHYFQKVMCCCCMHVWHDNSLNKTQKIYLQQHSMSLERKTKSCRTRMDSKSMRQSETANYSPQT